MLRFLPGAAHGRAGRLELAACRRGCQDARRNPKTGRQQQVGAGPSEQGQGGAGAGGQSAWSQSAHLSSALPRTWYASPSCWNLALASGSPGFLSGCMLQPAQPGGRQGWGQHMPCALSAIPVGGRGVSQGACHGTQEAGRALLARAAAQLPSCRGQPECAPQIPSRLERLASTPAA